MPTCKYKSLLLGCFTAVIAVLCLCVTPVYATDRYGTTVTMTENSYNRNLLTMPDLSTKEKTQTTTQTIVLDDNARVRADQGELRLSASVRVGANGSRTNTRELRPVVLIYLRPSRTFPFLTFAMFSSTLSSGLKLSASKRFSRIFSR